MTPAILVLFSVLSVHSAPARDASAQKIWMNDDVEWLRANAPISVIGSLTVVAPAAPNGPYVAELDPDVYRKEIDARQAQIDAANAQIRSISDIRRTGVGISGTFPLDRESAGITPEATIQILQDRNKELAAEIDSLQELARHNSIPPGAIR